TTTQKDPTTDDKKLEESINKVLEKQGLLEENLSKTVVTALSKDPVQLRRLDELINNAAL
ncbi:hypothetical protein KR215_002217, partial [Drosophila sulfurigaster]